MNEITTSIFSEIASQWLRESIIIQGFPKKLVDLQQQVPGLLIKLFSINSYNFATDSLSLDSTISNLKEPLGRADQV